MVLFFALVIVIAIALIYDQYLSTNSDALDRSGKPMHKGNPRSSNKNQGRSSSQISRKHRTGKAA